MPDELPAIIKEPKKMPKGGRLPKEVAQERERIAWDLRLKGMTHHEIADFMGLNRSAVTKLLKRIRSRVNEKLDSDVGQHRSEQIARLERIYKESMDAWENSKLASKTVIKEEGQIGRASGQKTTVKVEDADGDPRYLNIAMQALADLRKILSLDAPSKKIVESISTGELLGLRPEDREERINRILGNAESRKKLKRPLEERIPDRVVDLEAIFPVGDN